MAGSKQHQPAGRPSRKPRRAKKWVNTVALLFITAVTAPLKPQLPATFLPVTLAMGSLPSRPSTTRTIASKNFSDWSVESYMTADGDSVAVREDRPLEDRGAASNGIEKVNWEQNHRLRRFLLPHSFALPSEPQQADGTTSSHGRRQERDRKKLTGEDLSGAMRTTPLLNLIASSQNVRDITRLSLINKDLNQLLSPLLRVTKMCMTSRLITVSREGGYNTEHEVYSSDTFYPYLNIRSSYTEDCYEALRDWVLGSSIGERKRPEVAYIMQPEGLRVLDFRFLIKEEQGHPINPLGVTHLTIKFPALEDIKAKMEHESFAQLQEKLLSVLPQVAVQRFSTDKQSNTPMTVDEAKKQESEKSQASERETSTQQASSSSSSSRLPPRPLKSLELRHHNEASGKEPSKQRCRDRLGKSGSAEEQSPTLAQLIVRAVTPPEGSKSSLEELTLYDFCITRELAQDLTTLFTSSSLISLRLIDCKLGSAIAHRIFFHHGLSRMTTLKSLEIDNVRVDTRPTFTEAEWNENVVELASWKEDKRFPTSLTDFTFRRLTFNDPVNGIEFASQLAESSISSLTLDNCAISNLDDLRSLFRYGIRKMKHLKVLTIENLLIKQLAAGDGGSEMEEQDASGDRSRSEVVHSSTLSEVVIGQTFMSKDLADELAALLRSHKESIKIFGMYSCAAETVGPFEVLLQALEALPSLQHIDIHGVEYTGADDVASSSAQGLVNADSATPKREDLRLLPTNNDRFLSALGSAITAKASSLTYLSLGNLLPASQTIRIFSSLHNGQRSPIQLQTTADFCGAIGVAAAQKLERLEMILCPFCNDHCGTSLAFALREAGGPTALKYLDISHWTMTTEKAFAELLEALIPARMDDRTLRNNQRAVDSQHFRVPSSPSSLQDLKLTGIIANLAMISPIIAKLPKFHLQKLNLDLPSIAVPDDITAKLLAAARHAQLTTLRLAGEGLLRSDRDNSRQKANRAKIEHSNLDGALFKPFSGFVIGRQSMGQLEQWLSLPSAAELGSHLRSGSAGRVEGLKSLSLSAGGITFAFPDGEERTELLTRLARIVLRSPSSSSLEELALSFLEKDTLHLFADRLQQEALSLTAQQTHNENNFQRLHTSLTHLHIKHALWNSPPVSMQSTTTLVESLSRIGSLRSAILDFSIDTGDASTTPYGSGADLLNYANRIFGPLMERLDMLTFVCPDDSTQWLKMLT